MTVSPPSQGGAEIDVDQTPLNFGNVPVGQSREKDLMVKNIGSATLSVSSIGSNKPDFGTVPLGVTFEVAAGGEHLVKVRFALTSAGPQTGTLSINSNDPDEPTLTVLVAGMGSASAPKIVVDPTLVNFEAVPIGSTSPPEFIAITNTGNAPLEVAPITITESGTTRHFRVVSPTGAFTVAAGGTTDVRVTFSPNDNSPQTGTLTINSNASDEPPIVSLRGTGEPDQQFVGGG